MVVTFSRIFRGLPCNVLYNILLLYVLYMLCRIAFLLENWHLFADGLSWQNVISMLQGGLVFDTAAIFYTNVLYLFLAFSPLHIKETWWWRRMLKCLFVITNSVCLLSCLADSVYFPFGNHRATMLTFDEFGGNTNTVSIIGLELLQHGYLTILGIAIVAMLVRLYQDYSPSISRLWNYYTQQIFVLILAICVSVIGIRGGATTAIRPIAVSNAYQYVDKPIQTGIVLNTPFSIIRTMGKTNVVVPKWYGEDELDKIYSPVHVPQCDAVVRKKNVVILIVESFSREFVGSLNGNLDGSITDTVGKQVPVSRT